MRHVIRNFDALAENELRNTALSVVEAGYAAINVGNALKRKLSIEDDVLHIENTQYRLAERRIFFVGVGKCSLIAAEAIEEIFGNRLTAGIAFDVSNNSGEKLNTIETITGTHPLPSETNRNGTERIVSLLSDLNERDLVIMVISGGGSTLLCLPEAPTTADDEAALFKELTAHGTTIQELNTVRKHLSSARGGGLARAAYPAEVISLIVSDVPGNDLASISSGPTVLDSSTISDAKAVLEKYGIMATDMSLMETPKEEKYFERVTNILFLSNRDALSAMLGATVQLGYTAEIVDDHFVGEAQAIGREIAEKLHTTPPKTALLYAGESTVTLINTTCQSNSGGRNQEMALAALEDILPDELILPFASDGRDNTDHAGAIADTVTRAHAEEKKLPIVEYLNMHRSYEFFYTTGDALVMGYTGSNVSDLVVALKK